MEMTCIICNAVLATRGLRGLYPAIVQLDKVNRFCYAHGTGAGSETSTETNFPDASMLIPVGR